MKKILALVLALVLVLSLAACAPAVDDPKDTTAGKNETAGTPDGTTAGTPDGTTAGSDGETTEEPYAPLFNKEDNVKITVWCAPNTDLEFDGCFANLAINKVTNAEVTLYEYPDGQTYKTAMAEKKVPQITYHNGLSWLGLFGEEGAYINILDYIDEMPNVKAILEDEQWADAVQQCTQSEGVMYGLPIVQTGFASVWGYLYRQDIFEKNNLTFPTTQQGFYDTLVALKEIYPDSYPFVMRQMSGNMQGLEAWGYGWGGANHELSGYFNTVLNFDHSTNSYYLAQTSDQSKEMVAFLNKLYEEDLLHPSCLTIDTAGWIEALATDVSFITYDKADRVPAITAGASNNKDFVLTGAAPIAMGSKGVAESKQQGPGAYAYSISAVQSEEDLKNALAYIDWLYSEEGIETCNWGIENESYVVDADGNKSWKEGFTYAGSGLGVVGIVGYRVFDVYVSAQAENFQNALNIMEKYDTGKLDPFLHYNESEQATFDMYATTVYQESLAYLQKFILGELDTEKDWAGFEKKMEDLGLEELFKIHESAYEREYKK